MSGALSPDNEYIVSGGGVMDHNIIVWKRQSGELLKKFKGNKDMIANDINIIYNFI